MNKLTKWIVDHTYLIPPAVITILFAGAVLQGCGDDSAKASGGYTALEINGVNGVRCFVILDGNSNAVGGNCQ